MPVEFDEEDLKNIIYILGSEKGLGSVDKFFFLNTARNSAYPINIIRMSITFLNHIWVSCHRKKTWRYLLRHFSSLFGVLSTSYA